MLLQKLCQFGQPRIHFLFAVATLKIEVYTAAGTKTLAILGAEEFCVHGEDKRRSGEVTQIHFIVFQKHDILVIVKLPFLCENTRGFTQLFLGELFGAPITDAVKRRLHLHLAQEHSRFVPDPTFHIDRLGNGFVGTKFQIG